ncbi:hypothetical protein ACFL2J_03580 [Candidatus Omnitrophota bacterium]
MHYLLNGAQYTVKKMRKKLKKKSYLRPELKKHPKIGARPVMVFESCGPKTEGAPA